MPPMLTMEKCFATIFPELEVRPLGGLFLCPLFICSDSKNQQFLTETYKLTFSVGFFFGRKKMQRLLSIREVASTLGCSETSISRQVKEGTMVKPVRVGHRVTFPSNEVYSILSARIKGENVQFLKQLATSLVEKRQEA